LIEKEYGKSRLLLLKDPRICRFFPFWLRALDELDIVPKVVLPLRHPQEVMQSLRAREQFGRGRGQLLWLRHVLDAEYASRHVERCFVRYTDLLGDWRREAAKLSRKLGIKWPRMSGAVEVEIDEYLGSELRHQVADRSSFDEVGELATWVRLAEQALEQLVDGAGDETEARRVLDGIRTEFDRTAVIYGSVVREQVAQSEGKANELGQALDARAKEAGTLSARLEEVERARNAEKTIATAQARRVEELTERLATLDKLSAHNARLAESSTRATESMAVQVATHVQALAEMQARQVGSDVMVQSLREKLSAQADELAARESECTAFKRAEAELEGQLSSKIADLDQHIQAEAALRGQLQSSAAQIEQHARDEAALREELRAGAIALEERVHAEAALRQQLQSSAAQIEQHARDEAALREELRAGAIALEERVRAEAALRQQLQSSAAQIEQHARDEATLRAELQARAKALEERARTETTLRQQLQASAARLEQHARDEAALRDELLASANALEERVRTEALLRKELQEIGARIRERDATVAQQSSRVRVLEAGNLDFQQQLDVRFDELTRLTRRVIALEDSIEKATAENRGTVAALQAEISMKEAEIQWLQEQLQGIVGSTSWRMTKPMRTVSGWLRRDATPAARGPTDAAAQVLRESGRFDETWYLERYPDVRESNVDPVMHYLHHGADEDRDPSPSFSTAAYRANNPELTRTGVNPLLHSLLQHGTSQAGVANNDGIKA
jgi:hypothetical protein